MTTARRNFLLPGMVIATGIAMLLLALDIPHENLADLIRRSWPVLLMVAGLNMLLIDRVRFGNWIALALSAVGLVVIVYFAYDTRANEARADYVEELGPVPLGDNIRGVNVDVNVRDVTVTFRAADNGERAVGARFVGSTESEVHIAALEDEEGIVNLSVIEDRPNAIPNLEKMGRGELEVLLPVGVPVTDLTFISERGGTTLDFRALDVPRFGVEQASGQIDLWLPLRGVAIGDVTLDDGDVAIIIETEASLRVEGTWSAVNVDQNAYSPLAGGTIESRGGLVEFQYNLRADVFGGALTIETPEEHEARIAAEEE